MEHPRPRRNVLLVLLTSIALARPDWAPGRD